MKTNFNLKKLIVLSGFVFGLVSLSSCGSEVKENQEGSKLSAAPEEIKVVCDPSNLPEGWVIVSHGNSAECRPMRDWNSYGIKKAGDRETVCTDSPIPRGYVKKRLVQTGVCGYSFRENAIQIERL